ncbi:MATE family efflux transporter [Pseudaeromonas paramecii]|uniref:MATE family efflux transporter n=1 Tax=Pseudaeromonas paramecii TaxID=2138166 RepID=A0ABP8QJ15_9GAMM
MFKDKQFIADIMRIALPITIQSVIMSLLSMADQLMVGQLGEVAIAAVGISAKLTSIVSVVLGGLAAGISIFCAQYWGKRDETSIRHLLGFGLLIGLLFAGALALLVGCLPRWAMSPFTTDETLLNEGAIYVQLLAWSYLPCMLTMMYSAVLRSTGQVKLPMYASTSAVVINVVLNYLLIFGHLGFPKLGLMGAAIATCLARSIEFLIILVAAYWQRHVVAFRHLGELFGMEAGLFRRFFATCLPIVMTELLWVLGESGYAVVYGRMGTDEIAAMTMTYPLQGLAIGLLCGLAGAASVLVGNRLGAGNFDGAIDYANKLIRIGVLFALAVGGLVALASPFYVALYGTSAEVQQMGQFCVLVFCGFLWVKVANMIVAGGVLNSGGDSKFVFAMESMATWLVGVPSGFLMAFYFELPVYWVYLVLSFEELVRLMVGYARVRSKKWVRSLVDDEPQAALAEA